MRLRWSRFDGLRLSLDRGWYVVPSHLSIAEVRRMTDVLVSGVDGVHDVVEIEWNEWDFLSPGIAPPSLIYLRASGNRSAAEVESRVASRDVRLGLIHMPDVQCWPDAAWDELEVKPALVGWFRRQFARPDHPLAPIAIASLPLELLVGATAEPMELIALVEATITTCFESGEPTPERWLRSAYASIARRLAARIGQADVEEQRAIVEVLRDNEDGHLRASAHRHPSAALERVGLSLRTGDDVALGPLARCARVPEVRELLEELIPPPTLPSKDIAPHSRRTEAHLAFDPFARGHQVRLTSLTNGLASLGYAPARRIERSLLGDRDVFRKVVVAHQPGMGASTYINEALDNLAVVGLMDISVDLLRIAHDPRFESEDIVLEITSQVCDRFTHLAAYRSDNSIDAALSELQRSIDSRRASRALSNGPIIRPLLQQLNKILDFIHKTIADRQQKLCISLRDLDKMVDRRRASEILQFIVMHLADIRASLLIECALADLMIPPGDRVTLFLPVVQIPPLPLRAATDFSGVVRPEVEQSVSAILGAAGVEVDRLFPDRESVHELARLSGGCLRQLFQLAHRSLEVADTANSETISIAHIARAADQLGGPLAALATPRERERLAAIANERHLSADDAPLVARSLVFVYDEGSWADVNPLLWTAPWMNPS